MSLIDSLPRVRAPQLPRADGLIPWIVPLAIILVWQLACVTGFVPARVLPAPSDVALAGWKLLLSGELAPQHLGQLLARQRRLRDRRRHRLRVRPRQRPVAAVQQAHRHDAADGAQHSASGADPAGHPVVRHRRIGKAVPGRARRVLPDLPQHAARHPHRRSATDRDGPHLRHDRRRTVPPGDLSRRAAVDLRRPALCARHHVADADRGRDHRGVVRPRLHGDAGARIHADRRRRALAS